MKWQFASGAGYPCQHSRDSKVFGVNSRVWASVAGSSLPPHQHCILFQARGLDRVSTVVNLDVYCREDDFLLAEPRHIHTRVCQNCTIEEGEG